MSEYFAAWKNSRFIAGEGASENAFVAASRLQDIADILGGLVLVYDNVEPLVAKADPAQAKQTKQSLAELREFAADLLGEEDAGAQVHRRGGRHPRLAGPGARGGDRRPGHPGGLAAGHRDRGGLSGEARPSRPPHRSPAGAGGVGRRAAQAAPPWQSAQRAQDLVFEAQTALLLDEPRSATALTTRARIALRGPLARGLRRDAPEAYRAALAALAAARRAASDGDEVELAAAAGSLRAALLLGSYRTTVAAVAAGDADRAASWLLLREFRKATRFTRPGVDATVAVSALAAGRLAPRKATLEVRKDLLDAYQASLTTRLGEAEAAAERGFDARWRSDRRARRRPLADRRSRVPGHPRRRRRRAGRPGVRPACEQRSARRFPRLAAARTEVSEALDGFVAAPFTRAEQARRAAQLVRFLDLIPIDTTAAPTTAA